LLIRAFLGVTLARMGKFDEAAAQFRQLPPDYLFRLIGEAIMFAQQGNRAGSDAALQRAKQVYGDDANYQYADVYAQQGDKDRAFAALDRAWSFRDPGLAFMKSDEWLDPIRSDPRFTALLQKMNFPPA
jgi:tetratricopeptide (TPR) repeat protein